MSSVQRISDAQWERHKAEIERLYVKENRKREDVMAIMAEQHGFRASKEQYVRRFKKWNFSKHVTGVSWAIVSHKVQKRRINGKDSMIYHKGKSVPDKKARKEMSRHARSVWDQFSNRAASPATPEDMIVCTPKGQCPISITFATVPWFNFQERFDFGPHFAFGLDNLVRNPATLLFSQPRSGEDSPISALVLPKLGGPHTRDGPPTALDVAEVIHDQDFHDNASFHEQSSEVSSARSAIQLAHATIFMSSNNHLLYDDTDRFVKSIIDNKMYWVLETILAPRTPTTEVLATNLLIVACQYNDVRTVSLLMSLGADLNVRKRFPDYLFLTTESISPLSQAIRKGRLAVLEKLIEGGAKVNPASVAASRWEASWLSSPSHCLHPDDYLMEALASPETNTIVQLLVEKGADVEKSPILAFVVDLGDVHLTRILLNAGAFNGAWKNPFAHNLRDCEKQKIKGYCATPLQIAAENNNMMMVHTLLNGDSNVNVPSRLFMEPMYLSYRVKYWGTACISPLVHAASNGNLEMIKVLLNNVRDSDTGVENRLNLTVTDPLEAAPMTNMAVTASITDVTDVLIV